ncbi:MAG: TRL-like family protein [Bacteroidales bacterium]|nr:TRL-like family protein [Bacteroidales bacterium]
MKKLRNLLIIAVVGIGLFSLQGCAVIPSPAGVGFFYTGVTYPSPALAVDCNANVKSDKIGKSEATNILGAVVVGDCSIEAAMKAGGITKIHHVDTRTESVLIFFAKKITIVYGE